MCSLFEITLDVLMSKAVFDYSMGSTHCSHEPQPVGRPREAICKATYAQSDFTGAS